MATAQTDILVLNVTPPAATGGDSELQTFADTLAPGEWGIMPTPTWNGSTFEMYVSWVSRGYYDAVNNRLVVMTKEPRTGGDGTPEANLFIYDIDTDTWTNPYRGYPGGTDYGHPWEYYGVSGDTGEIFFWAYANTTYTLHKWDEIVSTGTWPVDSVHTGYGAAYGFGMAWNPYLGNGNNTSDPGWVVTGRNAAYMRRPGFTGNLANYKIFDLTPTASGTDGSYNNVLYWPLNRSVLIGRWGSDSTHVPSTYTYPGATQTVKLWNVLPGVSGGIPAYVRMPDMPISLVGSGAGTSGPQGKLIMSPSGENPLIITTEKNATPGKVYSLQATEASDYAWSDHGVISPFHRTDMNPRGNRPFLVTCPNEGVIIGLINTGSGSEYSPSAINMVVWKPPAIVA